MYMVPSVIKSSSQLKIFIKFVKSVKVYFKSFSHFQTYNNFRHKFLEHLYYRSCLNYLLEFTKLFGIKFCCCNNFLPLNTNIARVMNYLRRTLVCSRVVCNLVTSHSYHLWSHAQKQLSSFSFCTMKNMCTAHYEFSNFICWVNITIRGE